MVSWTVSVKTPIIILVFFSLFAHLRLPSFVFVEFFEPSFIVLNGYLVNLVAELG